MILAKRWREAIVPILLTVVLLLSACSSKPPSRFADAQRSSNERGAQPAVARDATEGGSFNKFFPDGGEGYARVFSQEKPGFAEAKLNKGGKNVAVLSVNDIKSTPTAAAKYANATEKIGAYPVADQGSTTTGVLVNNRYQVKAASRDASFTRADRLKWLKKFNLNGLAGLR
jgi:hypothetical protein